METAAEQTAAQFAVDGRLGDRVLIEAADAEVVRPESLPEDRAALLFSDSTSGFRLLTLFRPVVDGRYLADARLFQNCRANLLRAVRAAERTDALIILGPISRIWGRSLEFDPVGTFLLRSAW
jgi:hypothetical protein